LGSYFLDISKYVKKKNSKEDYKKTIKKINEKLERAYKMKIIQIMPTIAFGDAVSNDALALMDILAGLGYETAIYAENVDERLNMKYIYRFKDLPRPKEKDVVIYHMSTGSGLAYQIESMNCRKIMIYHNVTPPLYFAGYSAVLCELTQKGVEQVKYLADKFDYCLADSEYNKQDLLEYGYTCPIDVLPIIIPFEDYYKMPNQDIADLFGKDNNTNILFLGRIAPNKKQEDIIAAFYQYKRYYNPTARLFLVGAHGGMEEYYARLQKYVLALDLRDVYFTGHISFADILAYYQIADVFLCLSEHEGFCVPLVEAMLFDIPVIAYDAAAVKYTLNGAGVLLQDKNPLLLAGWINRLIKDNTLKKQILQSQTNRLKSLQYEPIKEQFTNLLNRFLELAS